MKLKQTIRLVVAESTVDYVQDLFLRVIRPAQACGAPDFHEKHPSCGYMICCAKNHGFEICAECTDYPCK